MKKKIRLDAGDSLPWDLLDRYYAGEVTPAEHEVVIAYLAKQPDQARIMGELVNHVHQNDSRLDTQPAIDVDGMLATAHERMQPQVALKRMVHTLFGGSIERAVTALLDLEDTDLSESEVARLRQAIAQAKREGR